MEIMQRAEYIAEQIRRRSGFLPSAGLILGSGWGGVAEALENKTIIPYAELDEMPLCGVAGHAGNFILGFSHGFPVILVQGRFHLYEGRDCAEVVLPVAVVRALGAQKLLLTNAAGGVNYAYSVGDMMVLNDHINLTGKNPLVGVRPTEKAPVFVDMTHTYDQHLSDMLSAALEGAGLKVRNGVYMQLLGPSYETPAEIRAYRTLGADAVGMSTAIEAIFARYLGMRVCAVSCITNMAAGMGDKLNHEDVLEQTSSRSAKFEKAIELFLKEMACSV